MSTSVADAGRAASAAGSASTREVERVAPAAELHDIGKIAIPDAILNKPGPLDEAEWEFMRRHTLIGERILQRAPALAAVAGSSAPATSASTAAATRTGSPATRSRSASRIVAVCDAFDGDDHGPRLPRGDPEAARSRSCGAAPGTQFDPAVVEAFLAERSWRSLAVPAFA